MNASDYLLAVGTVFVTIWMTLLIEWVRSWKVNKEERKSAAESYKLRNFETLQEDLEQLWKALDLCFIRRVRQFYTEGTWSGFIDVEDQGSLELREALSKLQIHATRIPLVALPDEIHALLDRIVVVQSQTDGKEAIDELTKIKSEIGKLQKEIGLEIRRLLT